MPQGEIEPAVEQHQPEGSPTFLPMTETQIIRPQCESVEATSHHTDELGFGEMHRHEATKSELIDHGVLDMGFNDGTPQELPGMELGVMIEDETDLKDFMKTRTRYTKEVMTILNRELLGCCPSTGR